MTQLLWNIRNEFSQMLERWWWHLFWLQILISLPRSIWAKWPFFGSFFHANGIFGICNNNNNNNRIERRNSTFFTISSLRHELSPTRTLKWPERNRVRVTCYTLSAYHVQPAVCHLVRRDSSAIKFDRVEIAIILALFYWLKPLTDEGNCDRVRQPSESEWHHAQLSQQTRHCNTLCILLER